MLTILGAVFGIFSLHGYECESECLEPCKVVRAEVGYAFGDFIGVNRDYLELALFTTPYRTENEAGFVDGRTYLFEDGRWGASIGAGYRRKVCDSCQVFGANIYYDCLDENYKTFHELGVGLEWLSPCWDFRINGYYHVGSNRSYSAPRFYQFDGGYNGVCKMMESSYDRIDGEVGRRFCYSPCGTWVYLGAGPYYAHSAVDDFAGGFFRAEVSWRDILSLEGRVSYDKVYKARAQGRILISIPLERLFCCSPCCRDILIEPVRRNGVMFTDGCCDWTWNW